MMVGFSEDATFAEVVRALYPPAVCEVRFGIANSFPNTLSPAACVSQQPNRAPSTGTGDADSQPG